MSQPAVCAHCGRRMPAGGVDYGRRYCSAGCRSACKARLHRELEEIILELLAVRDPSASMCPSEAARRRFGDDLGAQMENVRRAARRLAHRGVVVITQRGRTVDPAEIRGPVRIARGPRFDGSPTS